MSKRKSFSVKEKYAIISRIENGDTNSKLAAEFQVSHSTISTIWKNREKIEQHFENNSQYAKKLRLSNYKDIDIALLKWLTVQRGHSVRLSAGLLQAKAEDFSRKFGMADYKCSVGWVQRFMKRHNLVLGRTLDPPPIVQSNCSPREWFYSVWPLIRAGYTDSQIYNANEMGLFYKITPDRLHKFKTDKLTILTIANMTGTDKQKLLVIGKTRNPSCLKNLKLLPVSYDSNSRCWMTSILFEKHLRLWDLVLKKENKKILLLIDNCPAHPPINNLNSIKLVFTPPNILQPMELGIATSLKEHFRKLQILTIIKDLDTIGTHKYNTLLDAMLMISKAWNRVSTKTIRDGFGFAGFPKEEVCLKSTDDIVDVPFMEWLQPLDYKKVATIEEWECFLKVDEHLCTTGEVNDDEIVMDVLSEAEANINLDSENDLETCDDIEIKPPTTEDALNALKTLNFYFLSNDNVQNEKTANNMLDLENCVEETYYKLKFCPTTTEKSSAECRR